LGVGAAWYTSGMNRTRRDLILACIEDAVSDLLYYDRKEDEDLPSGAIEAAVEAGEITVDDMVARFRVALQEGMRMSEGRATRRG
jgi:hypothetical protein